MLVLTEGLANGKELVVCYDTCDCFSRTP